MELNHVECYIQVKGEIIVIRVHKLSGWATIFFTWYPTKAAAPIFAALLRLPPLDLDLDEDLDEDLPLLKDDDPLLPLPLDFPWAYATQRSSSKATYTQRFIIRTEGECQSILKCIVEC